MLRPGNEVQVYLYNEPVDMRKSMNGLSILVEQEMDLSPNMDALFVFCNRGRDKIKKLGCYTELFTGPRSSFKIR